MGWGRTKGGASNKNSLPRGGERATLRAALCVCCPLLLAGSAQAEAGDKTRTSEETQAAWDDVMAWGTEGASGESEARPAGKARTGKARAGKGKGSAKNNGGSSRLRAKPVKKGVSAGYLALSSQWHAAASPDETYLSDTTPALVFHVVGMQSPVVVLVPEEHGGPFEPEQLEAARQAFRARANGPGVNERLLGLIHRATRHFDVPYVHLVSGVRQDRGASRHTHGLAADIVLPGVSDEELAAFFRAQGFVGVGIYTRSGFVHVDVRERSFFWLDPSPPGRNMKIIPVLAAEAKAADAEAQARGEEPLVNPPRLSRALEKRNAVRRKKNAGKAVRASSEAKPSSTKLTVSSTRSTR